MTPDRRRVARTFSDQNHPMIDEIAGPARSELDPGIAWPDHEKWQPPRKKGLRATLAAIFGRP